MTKTEFNRHIQMMVDRHCELTTATKKPGEDRFSVDVKYNNRSLRIETIVTCGPFNSGPCYAPNKPYMMSEEERREKCQQIRDKWAKWIKDFFQDQG